MKVNNNAPFNLIAFCWHKKYGYGDDTEIPAGESAEVPGPSLGEMGGGDCTIIIEGEISCHERENNEEAFHVSMGNQLSLESRKKGITIRHFSEPRKFN